MVASQLSPPKNGARKNYQLEELVQSSLVIDNMTCISCAYGIEYAWKELEGVVDGQVGFTDDFDGIGEIIYNPSLVTPDEIIKAAVPYPAKVVSTKAATTKTLPKLEK
jgi:copper chaperone CopZ